MSILASIRQKGFVIHRFGNVDPLRAEAEVRNNPRYDGMPPEVMEAVLPEMLHGLKLTMPDGSEWWVSESTWQYIGMAIQASREFHEQADSS